MNRLFILLTVTILFTSLSCKKDKLTKETQVGANTFSCKVNREVFLPGVSPLFSGPSLFRAYDASSKWLNIYAQYSKTDPHKIINMEIQPYTGVGKYYISSGNASLRYQERYPDKSYVGIGGGWINISKDDGNNMILSGTFEFDAVNSNDVNDVVSVTSGRFDLSYK